MQELTVVIPTKDDHYRVEENIENVLNYLKLNIQRFEVLIVSNGSSVFSQSYIDDLVLGIDYIKHLKIDKIGGDMKITIVKKY